MEPTRKFKIIVNSKECGTCSGPTPSAVAKKVVKKLCGSLSKVVKFSLKECKRGCERECGPYQGRMEKLDKPYKRGGKTITHRVVCGKFRKMRGGVLGQDGDLLTIDDFNLNNSEYPSFFKEDRIEETKEQYIFFDLSYLISNDNDTTNLYRYRYVAIRKNGSIFRKKEVIFKRILGSIIEIININEIDLSILLKLYEEITKKITENGLVAQSIYDKLDHYIIGITENLVRNNRNTISKLASLFKITEIDSSIIKVFSFKNNIKLIFFHIIRGSHDALPYYQYVIIRDKNKGISLKEYEGNNNVSNISFKEFLNRGNQENYDSFQILQDLFDNINQLIQEQRFPSDFATTIREKLKEILKNKMVSNSLNANKLIRYFRIKNIDIAKPIKYITFGSHTSRMLGDKYQFIFFNIINRNIRSSYYQYVIIRDKSKNILLKEYNGTDSVSDINFEQFIQDHRNFEILQGLLDNINKLIQEQRLPSDFATTIREKLTEKLKNKMVSNFENNTKLIPYFNIERKSNTAITVYEFGSHTSSMLGDKYQFIFFNIINRNNGSSYYQYVIIRDNSQTISLKEYNGRDRVSDIDFEQFIQNHDNFQILQGLLDNINKLIQEQRFPSNFATTIREKLTEILKNKMVSNSENNTKLIPYFNIERKSKTDITVYEFGSHTSIMFGNKYQFIFFNIINRNNGSSYYQYVIIRDHRQRISLKQYDGRESVSDITFEEILENENREGYIILEKLYRDIKSIRNERPNSNFATTIRGVLGRYIYGDKLDEDLSPTDFKIKLINNSVLNINTNIKTINIKQINGIKYIFFCLPIRVLAIIDVYIPSQDNTILKYSEFENNDKYYMFVVFLNEKGINFYQLIQYKDSPLIIHIDINIMSENAMIKLLEYLYKEINLMYDITNGTTNNSFFLKMLNSLEEYILKILNKERDLKLLRSRYFYIPEKEVENKNHFKIILMNDKTYIFFYRCKGKRILSQLSSEYILYKYVIIIDNGDINFYKVQGKQDTYSVFIRMPVKIEEDKIDRLLLGILYGHLLKYIELSNISEKIKKDIQKVLNLFNLLDIKEYYEFIIYFNKVLTSNIQGNRITINGRPIMLPYNGTFDFDFLGNKRNNEIFQNILDKLLKMSDIRKNNNSNQKFYFKPHIKAIVNNKLTMSNIKLNDNAHQEEGHQ